MRKLKPEELQNIEITVNQFGFTVWITETINRKPIRHWLLDGSCLKKDSKIFLPHNVKKYKYHTIVSDDAIKFVKLSKSERL